MTPEELTAHMKKLIDLIDLNTADKYCLVIAHKEGGEIFLRVGGNAHALAARISKMLMSDLDKSGVSYQGDVRAYEVPEKH